MQENFRRLALLILIKDLGSSINNGGRVQFILINNKRRKIKREISLEV